MTDKIASKIKLVNISARLAKEHKGSGSSSREKCHAKTCTFLSSIKGNQASHSGLMALSFSMQILFLNWDKFLGCFKKDNAQSNLRTPSILATSTFILPKGLSIGERYIDEMTENVAKPNYFCLT